MRHLLRQFNEELTALVTTILPSTVTITATSEDLSGGHSGSGWVYNNGLVVTNHHVLHGMVDPIHVRPVGAPQLIGTLVGGDPENDIAVLRVPGLKAQPIPLELVQPRLGELCVAIGSPHGLPESASFGIISGLSRQSQHPDGAIIEEMLQTDASVNPGSSGGPLVNIEGRLLGMNTMGTAETVNLAVSAETIAAIVPELIAHGSIARACLGISVAARQGSAGGGGGIEVTRVRVEQPEGLQKGDILRCINGRPIRRRVDVVRALSRAVIDQTVVIEVERQGQSLMLSVQARRRDPG
ncbi:MAG: trypsin-like peptidase domain-containing protein [Synechococcaceae cyanobacterium]|nr:trypsin-like peptidase domain-containing protein [Synechococcaceae cyanobacterium]